MSRVARCLLALSIGCLTPALPSAAGPACPLEDLPPYAGHAFPLEPELGTIGLSKPFPGLADFANPLLLVAEPPPPAPEPEDRVYVVQQRGLIRVFENRADVTDGDVSTFLDLTPRVHQSGNERGLMGFAFDPDFWTNGYLYVNYTAGPGNCDGPVTCTRVVRYEAAGSPPTLVGDGNPTLLIEFAQPFSNHNGGMLAFGPDGLLYVGAGDGGSGGDPDDRAQDTTDLLGSILRLDPQAPPDYIPSDNPFVGQPGAAEEIFHYGVRNPWRFSFDRATGDLWIGDVGQDDWEEIDFVPAGSPGGLNFGWRDCEGNHAFDGFACDLADPGIVFPVLEHFHNSAGAHSITGGYVYRGSRVPSLYGAYVYADFVNERIWAWDRVSAAPAEIDTNTVPSIASFGEDQSGELYVVSLNGGIWWFDELAPGSGGGPPPGLLSETGLFEDVASLTPAPGLVEYQVNAALWSDRARKRRWIALPAGTSAGFAATGAWTYPVGTAFVKHFELETAPGVFERIETRVLLLQETGWVGHTYRWNDLETDAALLPGDLDEVFDVALPGLPATQTWHYPGPAECLSCHTQVGGRVLGGRTRQLNRTFDYAGQGPSSGGGVAPQLEAWSCAGLVDAAIPDATVYEAFVGLDALNASIDERARSHLASNCAFCHQPGAPAPGSLDLRRDTLVDDMNLIEVPPLEGDLGLPDPLRVDPGDRFNSILWLRMASEDPGIRMAAGTQVPHPAAVDILGQWIEEELIDPDSDGLRSFEDNCPLDANGPLAGPNEQDDTDGDGLGDVCECSWVPGEAVVADGDFDRSGTVDAGDLAILDSHFGQLASSFDDGDANCDGVVDGADYTIWADSLSPGA